MEKRGDEIHLDKVEARAGESTHVTRYVLGIGLALVIIAFVIIVATGMFSAPDDTGGDATTNKAVAEQSAQKP
ncbi:hypothetical protein [Novosphingobium sp. Leaf2]|uniref:hypothetical protein n=1 Tax=Novosphingobium sp. Leaf2 TaxID=1735670 RepID=UPI0006FAC980|nr:hypothetical protein [Novosphingobium sp. Leaf2]KQM21560.1 hypothetical protein ASE49_14240 [Novosphingobium sp. Leaf2]